MNKNIQLCLLILGGFALLASCEEYILEWNSYVSYKTSLTIGYEKATEPEFPFCQILLLIIQRYYYLGYMGRREPYSPIY
jgi:hypothetical protein